MDKKCAGCGKSFGCGIDTKTEECWCASMPPLKPIPSTFEDCLCPDCLKTFAKTEDTTSALIPNEDYYYVEDKMVFTETYLLKRGYCCGSGCRHCPYN